MIKENQGSLRRFGDRGDLFHLAFADQGGRIRPGSSLQHFGDNFGPRAGDQLAKFCEGCIRFGGVWTRFLAGRVSPGSGDLGELRCFPRHCRRTRNGRGRETNSTPTSSARSGVNASDFQQTLIEAAADPALAFRHRAVRARPAKARSTRGRMADPGARTMITVQHRPRADHR